MTVFTWDEQKNKLLKLSRDISFEEIVLAIRNDNVISEEPHPNQKKYPNQFIFIIEYQNYTFVVPFEKIDTNTYLLKTIFKDRRYLKLLKKP